MNRQYNAISLARISAASLVGEAQTWQIFKHRLGKCSISLILAVLFVSGKITGGEVNKVSVAAGPQLNWIKYNGSMELWRKRNSVGGFIQITYARNIYKYVDLGTGLQTLISGGAKNLDYIYYSQSKTDPKLIDSSRVIGYFDEKIYTIGLPAFGRFAIPNTPIYLSTAILPEYILAVRLKSKGAIEPMDEVISESETNSYDKLNVSGELSAGINIGKVQIFCKYDLGFIDIAKHPSWSFSKKTNSLGIGIGYQIYGW